MTRSELCVRVAAATSLSKADAAAAVGAVFSAIADALAKGETVAGRRVRELHHQGPRGTCRSQPSDRRSRRYRRLSSAGLQGREGPSRRGPRIASTPTSLDPRRLQRPCRRAPAVAHHGTTAPSAPTRGDTPALKFRCFLIACTRSIAGPVPTATGGSQSRLRPLLSGPSRCLDARAPGRLGQGGEVDISAIRHRCEHLRRPAVHIGSLARAYLSSRRDAGLLRRQSCEPVRLAIAPPATQPLSAADCRAPDLHCAGPPRGAFPVSTSDPEWAKGVYPYGPVQTAHCKRMRRSYDRCRRTRRLPSPLGTPLTCAIL